LQPQPSLVLRYLSDFFPDGPWVLTAIHTDRSGTITRTFRPDTATEMTQWVETMNLDHHNLYYHVGIPIRDLERKAERADIDKVLWLHVDMDPRGGIDPEICRQQAISLLENGKDGIPPPTVAIDSGGGIQAFWRLNDYIEIGGDVVKAEKAKAHNQRLEVVFDADNCHNIDRIMRLPGTVNWPTARKIRKGREPRLSKVLWFNKERAYGIERFPPLQATQSQFSVLEGDDLEISGNIERVDIDDLDKWEVADRVKVICVQGMHPDEVKDGDNSRSAWLFDALTRLVKAEVPDQMIYSIITDPDMGISESVLENPNSEKYAKRQITRAKQFAIDPQLLEMNSKHAVVGNWGGKCVVVEEVEDLAMDRSRLTRTSFADIRNRYCNRQVQVGESEDGKPKCKPLGDWWLKHPQRREYETLAFAPGKDLPGVYNLWRGFGVESVPGDCGPFLEHVRVNLCDNNDKYYDYLIRWMARAVQCPDQQGEVAIVLRGDQGTGKSFFAKELGALFGRHFLTVSDPKHLVGSFNSHLRDCVLLFGDEAFFAGDKKHESTLKTLVTDNMIAIEAKGVDVEVNRNYVHLILASNSDWVIPAGASERRYYVLNVTNEQRQKSGYFQKLADQMQTGGGRQALLHYLMTFDLSNWNVRTVPQTEALARQKIWTLGPVEEWWYRRLDDASTHPDHGYWVNEIQCEELIDHYLDYTKSYGITRRGNATKIGQFLNGIVPGLTRVQRRVMEEVQVGSRTKLKKSRPYVWIFPPLDVCREAWEEKFGEAYWTVSTEQERVNRERHFDDDEE